MIRYVRFYKISFYLENKILEDCLIQVSNVYFITDAYVGDKDIYCYIQVMIQNTYKKSLRNFFVTIRVDNAKDCLNFLVAVLYSS